MLRYLLLIALLTGTAACAAEVKQPKTCRIGGCSGQLCTNAPQENIFSTCEWRDEYTCYPKHGLCEIQPDGECGWTPNPAMEACFTDVEVLKHER
jgi:eight-cysteine-cluster-containing protein